MQLTPRYDDVPAIDMRLDVAAVRDPFLRQRRRLIDLAQSLTDEEMAAPSRCEGWSVANVLTHLIDVDRFWAMSGSSGVAGAPTRVLESFDPEATPKAMVEASSGLTPSEVRDRLAAATSALCDGVEALDYSAWSATAESPPGHVSLVSMLAHALWDAWIHERDIAVPLDLEVVDDPAEVSAVLAYAAVLAPALSLMTDDTRSGRLAVVATDPDITLMVEVADRTATVSPLASSAGIAAGVPTIEGRAADLADALSQRAALAHTADPAQHWMLDGLAEVFRASS